MAAGGAVFYNQVGKLLPQGLEEVTDPFHMLPQSLSQTFGAVAAQTDGVVVVQLHIAKAVFVQKIDDSLFQMVLHPVLPEVPEPPGEGGDGYAVPVE